MWKDKRVHVLGGTGFLGSRLTAVLREQGADVRPISTRNGWDLRDRTQAKGAVAGADAVFNCAAHQGGLGYQSVAPERIFTDNLLIQASVMEWHRVMNNGPLVSVTAGCGYPDGLEIMREEDWESGPVHHSVAAYGTVQRVKVQMTRAYWQAGCHRYIAPILINLYGPGDHFHPDKSHGMAALIRRFLDATEDGSGEVVLWGTGNAVREWTYVDDAVEGLMRLAEVYRSPDPVNLATGEGVSVGDLAREIASVVHFTGRIRFDPSKPEGVLRKIASVERLETHLGWKPSTSRLEGIERTVKHLVDHYEEAVA